MHCASLPIGEQTELCEGWTEKLWYQKYTQESTHCTLKGESQVFCVYI